MRPIVVEQKSKDRPPGTWMKETAQMPIPFFPTSFRILFFFPTFRAFYFLFFCSCFFIFSFRRLLRLRSANTNSLLLSHVVLNKIRFFGQLNEKKKILATPISLLKNLPIKKNAVYCNVYELTIFLTVNIIYHIILILQHRFQRLSTSVSSLWAFFASLALLSPVN